MADEIPSSSGNDTPQEMGNDPLEPPFAVRPDSIDRKSFAATAIVSFIVYFFTLAPDVTFEESGILVTGATYAGVTITPGSPAWTLYSWGFTKLLPFSNHAWRVAVGSAVATALANGLIGMMVSCGIRAVFENTWITSHLEESDRRWIRWGSGMCAGLVFAFSSDVWGYAVVAHFRAFSNMLFAGLVAAFSFWALAPERKRFLCLAFFLFGVLLTSNQELFIALLGLIGAIILMDLKLGRDIAIVFVPMLGAVSALFQWGLWIDFPTRWNPLLQAAFGMAFAVGLALIVITRRFGTEWRTTLGSGVLVMLGLAFYLYLPIASMSTPPVNWGYPRTVEGFLHVINRGQFEKAVPVCTFDPYLDELWLYVLATGNKFGWVQMLMSVLPLCFLHLMNRRGRSWLLGLLVIWLCVAPGMVVLLNPSPDRGTLEVISMYFMASHIVLAVWMGLGVAMLATWAMRPRQKIVRAGLPE